jgi:group II intron reverse transcriptase/maturase
LHHVDPESLKVAFERTRKDAAAGIDGITKEHYGRELDTNLEQLNDLVHRGAYRPKPSRRVWIPKEDGGRRPLAIGALEDKVVQRAVAEVLGAVYEEDFAGFSYAFRPGRNQHDALNALAVGINRRKVSWILDVDIKSYFDSIDHDKLLDLLQVRIADKRILRLIRRWLEAGVVEDGELTECKRGAAQGASISPLLANVYLHYVFDRWAGTWRRQEAKGDMILVRYADDIVTGFQYREDAERFRRALRERLADFSLELHPEKTHLIEFGRFAAERRAKRGQGKAESFVFLGIRHICGKSRKGRFQLKRRTDKKRLRAKLKKVRRELRRRMHLTIPEQGAWLRSVIHGYYQYHAIPTNYEALSTFRNQLARFWYETLQRRGQRDRTTWAKMRPRTERWLPRARVLHPWPSVAALRQ